MNTFLPLSVVSLLFMVTGAVVGAAGWLRDSHAREAMGKSLADIGVLLAYLLLFLLAIVKG